MNPDKELRTAYRLRHLLDQGAADLPSATLDQLAAARRHALIQKKSSIKAPQHVLQTSGIKRLPAGVSHIWLNRLGLLLPLAALVLGLIGISQHAQRQRILDTAELDAEMLTDELPIDAWLDRGFDAFMNDERRRNEQ